MIVTFRLLLSIRTGVGLGNRNIRQRQTLEHLVTTATLNQEGSS